MIIVVGKSDLVRLFLTGTRVIREDRVGIGDNFRRENHRISDSAQNVQDVILVDKQRLSP